MGSGTSKQAENDISDMSLSEIRSNSASVKKPVQDENEKAMEEHQNYLKNMYMLKRMFKQLDPAVMKTTGNVQGEVKIAVKHLPDKSMLLVKVIAAQDLLAKDVRGHTSDPYVKVELLMNKEASSGGSSDQSSVKCTTVAKNTCNPVYNEIFSFSLSSEEKNTAQIRCSVWCYDGLGKDDFMGEKIISLDQLECTDVIHVDWYELRPETDLSFGGEISIKLTYNLPQTLNVEVKEGRNFTIKNHKNLCVRVYIPGVPYVYKTKAGEEKEAEINWNENFDFPLPKEELSSRYVVLVLLNDKDKNSYLGECHIDLDNFHVEHGFEGFFPLEDMRGNVKVRSRWTRDALTQEFNEALQAHALYKRPQFLFGRVRGAPDTAVTVRVPKAGAQSRLRVINGVLVH